MAEPFTIYKLTILNMLDKVDFPLTNTQISDFFLEQEYTDYFRVPAGLKRSRRLRSDPHGIHTQQHAVLHHRRGA